MSRCLDNEFIMRRYKFLTKEDIYDTFNRLRDAFLAAKNGFKHKVEEKIFLQ